jgi:hypothetical protein
MLADIKLMRIFVAVKRSFRADGGSFRRNERNEFKTN